MNNKIIKKETTDISNKIKPPLSIKILTGFSIVGFISVFYSLATTQTQEIHEYYSILVGFSSFIGMISFIGMFLMRKWGVYLYSALSVFAQISLFSMGIWTVLSLIGPFIVLFFGFKHISKMK